jgi:hypothetical protein
MVIFRKRFLLEFCKERFQRNQKCFTQPVECVHKTILCHYIFYNVFYVFDQRFFILLNEFISKFQICIISTNTDSVKMVVHKFE